MRWLSFAALLLAGCFQAEAPDGVLTCSNVPGRLCPENYYCAPDQTCWQNGHPYKVDLSSLPLGPDFALPDWSPPDFSTADLSTVPDLSSSD
jgi:hypothetical protein